MQAVQERKALHWQWMRVYWLKIKEKNKGDIGALILPCENADSLIQLYLLYNNEYLSKGELPSPTTNLAEDGRPGIQLLWVNRILHPTGMTALGKTVSNDDWQPIKVLLLRPSSKQDYLTGPDVVAISKKCCSMRCATSTNVTIYAGA
ncbi:MAG: hypothetical protein Q9208_006812 [Pyrenodesmia sp. 3 TL-2023]